MTAFRREKRLPDQPGAILAHLTSHPPEPMPRWAMLALRRGEDVPGRVIPMPERWYWSCPVCARIVFLIHPYLMPALEEFLPEGTTSDLEELGCQTFAEPMNLIRTHEPCRFLDRSEPWDFQNETVKSLKDYLK